ncbi:MAG: cation diffusion facilitator family transporter [Geobacteraceae bacterium]
MTAPETNHQQEKFKAARISVLSNSLLVSIKLTVGILMGSVAVLSEAIHSGLDLLAAIIAFYAVGKSGKPADERHPYGHGKWENVSGVVEALLILAAAIYIIYEAVQRLMGNAEIEHLGLGSAVMAISALVNWFVSRYLFRVARKTRSVALEADAWHLRADVYTSIGVLSGLALIAITKITILDSLAAIAVALLIIKSSIELTISAMGDIFDVKLPAEDEAKVREILSRHEGDCIDFHRLRSRKSGSARFIDMHIVVPRKWSIEEAHKESDRIETEIRQVLPNTEVIIHIDPCSKALEPCTNCAREEENGTKTP